MTDSVPIIDVDHGEEQPTRKRSHRERRQRERQHALGRACGAAHAHANYPITRGVASRPSAYARPTVARIETTQVSRNPSPRERAGRLSRWLLAAVAGSFLLIVAPVVIRGGLLADEYIICLRPIHDGGYGPYLEAIWQDTGAVRPARFIELLLVSKTCTSVPFGLAILVPLALKFTAAYLLFKLLQDLRLRTPWPEIGAAIWLLEPLGTEAALWPAALHVLLGLTSALVAMRCYRSGRFGWAALATLVASLSVEQVIFALPLAAWLVAPEEKRRKALIVAIAVTATVLVAYSLWPGENPRQALTLAERLHNIFTQPEWYVFFPAVGLGLHSGTLALLWAFPLSIVAVVGAAMGGAALAPILLAGGRDVPSLGWRATIRGLLVIGGLVLLVNLPLIVTEVGYSARTFTPTWLVLSAAAAIGGSRASWRRTRILGALTGVFAATACLSMALSVSVRLRTDDFDQAAARWIASRTHDGDIIAVCDVGRTVVDPAPLGAFHLHALHSTSGYWIEYHTGRIVEVRRSGERYWGARCPDLTGADLVVRFPELLAALGR